MVGETSQNKSDILNGNIGGIIMLKIGTRVKIKEDLTENETKIFEMYLRNLRGKETTILKGKDAYTLEISKDRFIFEEDWLEVIEN